MSKKWSKEEIEILEKSNGEIPFVKERSRDAVREKMIELGLVKTKKQYYWTPEELRLLSIGATDIPGRSAYSIKQAKKRLKASKSLDSKNIPVTDWKNKENELILKDLHDHGFDIQEIFEMKIFNTSLESIRKKMKRLNLIEENFVKLPIPIKDEFKTFLVKNWENKTPRDLMCLWNKENKSYNVSVKQVVYYLAILNISISYDEIQKIDSLREKEKNLISSNKDAANKLGDKIRFERVKAMRDREEKSKDIWTGLSIPKVDKEEDMWIA